jgi:hypothetical protein
MDAGINASDDAAPNTPAVRRKNSLRGNVLIEIVRWLTVRLAALRSPRQRDRGSVCEVRQLHL